MLTLDKFEEASEKVKEVTTETKLVYSDYFSQQTGNKVYLKPENMQFTGAYKVRGAYYKISTLTEEERAKGLITASAGNHAQGVAYAAKCYGCKAVIVMPTTTPLIKVNRTKSYGAEVVLYGDVYDEACQKALVSRKLGISLDKIIGISFKSNAMFDMNIVDYDDPFESYYNILYKYVRLINTLEDDPNSSLGTSSNIIPQTLYLKHDLLAKFRLFKWMYQNKYIQCKSFEELELPQKLINIQKDYVDMTKHFHSIDYIWDSMIFQHLINDIQYFSSIHLISNEAKEDIKKELFLLTNELEDLATKGKTENGNTVRIYVSHINFEATYSYVETNNIQLSLIRVYSINSLTTMDNEIFCSLKEWIQSLKKFSTLISESGEMQRIQFFKQQREIIDTL